MLEEKAWSSAPEVDDLAEALRTVREKIFGKMK